MIIKPKIFNNNAITAAQSTRLGGVSGSPYESLNLGLSVKDKEEHVLKNRELFFNAVGTSVSRVAKSHQVHDNKVLIVTKPVTDSGYDALITNVPQVFLAVSIADCVPVLIHDEKNNAIAAIHAGWRGTAKNIVNEALVKMQLQYGTRGTDCKAYIGACISCENFEVSEEVAQHFQEDCKMFYSEKQKWHVDLKKANEQQLLNFGVLLQNIEISAYCTVKDNHLFFSHRKENGLTGRGMVVIGIK